MEDLIHDIIFLLFTVLILIYLYRKMSTLCDKKSKKFISLLNKHETMLNECKRKNKISKLKKSITLYDKLLFILKISDAKCVSIFKYDYSRTYIMFNFLLTIEKNGEILDRDITKKLPISSHTVMLDILKSKNNNIEPIDISNEPEILENINKIYYRNLFKDEKYPDSFIVLTYDNPNYEISEENKTQIDNIIHDIPNFI